MGKNAKTTKTDKLVIAQNIMATKNEPPKKLTMFFEKPLIASL